MATVTPAGRGLGFRRDPNRPAITPLSAVLAKAGAPVPPTVDMRTKFLLPVPDQAAFGTCTANACAAMFEYALLRQGVPVPHRKSRAYNYYCSGAREGDTADDGRDPHYCFASMAGDGICDESYWDYQAAHITGKPTPDAYRAAAHRHALAWYQVEQTPDAVRAALAAGYSVGIGIAVYQSFEGRQASSTGVVPIPATGERLLGGHMIVIVGYTDVALGQCPAGYLICRNSWSAAFGDQGHVYLPFSYLWLSGEGGPLTQDLLALEVVTGNKPAADDSVVLLGGE